MAKDARPKAQFSISKSFFFIKNWRNSYLFAFWILKLNIFSYLNWRNSRIPLRFSLLSRMHLRFCYFHKCPQTNPKKGEKEDDSTISLLIQLRKGNELTRAYNENSGIFRNISGLWKMKTWINGHIGGFWRWHVFCTDG